MGSLTLNQFKSRFLKPIDLKIAAGDCVTLAGPSGSGKTLLLRALADLDPHHGEVLLGDRTQHSYKAPEWRRLVGFLPTESHWWYETVGQHFSGINKSTLNDLGFERDCLEWQISRLSSGERQRLALARLLVNKPQFLLLDEPTANLDAENTERVEQIIGQYRKENGCGLFWVSHSKEQRQKLSDRSYLINNGQLEEETWT